MTERVAGNAPAELTTRSGPAMELAASRGAVRRPLKLEHIVPVQAFPRRFLQKITVSRRGKPRSLVVHCGRRTSFLSRGFVREQSRLDCLELARDRAVVPSAAELVQQLKEIARAEGGGRADQDGIKRALSDRYVRCASPRTWLAQCARRGSGERAPSTPLAMPRATWCVSVQRKSVFVLTKAVTAFSPRARQLTSCANRRAQ